MLDLDRTSIEVVDGQPIWHARTTLEHLRDGYPTVGILLREIIDNAFCLRTALIAWRSTRVEDLSAQ